MEGENGENYLTSFLSCIFTEMEFADFCILLVISDPFGRTLFNYAVSTTEDFSVDSNDDCIRWSGRNYR